VHLTSRGGIAAATATRVLGFPSMIKIQIQSLDWTGNMTAIGTVALALVTVLAIITTTVIALTDRRGSAIHLRHADPQRNAR